MKLDDTHVLKAIHKMVLPMTETEVSQLTTTKGERFMDDSKEGDLTNSVENDVAEPCQTMFFNVITPPNGILHEKLSLPFDSTIKDVLEIGKTKFDCSPDKDYVITDWSNDIMNADGLVRDVEEPRDFLIQETVTVPLESAIPGFSAQRIGVPEERSTIGGLKLHMLSAFGVKDVEFCHTNGLIYPDDTSLQRITTAIVAVSKTAVIDIVVELRDGQREEFRVNEDTRLSAFRRAVESRSGSGNWVLFDRNGNELNDETVLSNVPDRFLRCVISAAKNRSATSCDHLEFEFDE
jgi:hypothetical protein